MQHNSLLPAAVHNNAAWVDAVCRAHGLPTLWDAALWRCLARAPRFYPNAQTLTPDALAAQRAGLVAFIESGLPGAWAVKDAFATLDLADLGFAEAFTATWIARPSGALPPNDGLDWARVTTPAALTEWEAAWAGRDAAQARVFLLALLARDDVALLAAEQAGRMIGGAVLNVSQGPGLPRVVGLSNVFALEPDLAAAVWASAADAAARHAPGCALVGYETGEALAWAQAAGCALLGPLRIWARTG